MARYGMLGSLLSDNSPLQARYNSERINLEQNTGANYIKHGWYGVSDKDFLVEKLKTIKPIQNKVKKYLNYTEDYELYKFKYHNNPFDDLVGSSINPNKVR